MKNIAEFSKSIVSNNKLIDLIIADANLAHAMSWMSDETHQKFDNILGEL